MLRGLTFRQIEHPLMKWYNTYAPTVLTILSLLVFFVLPVKPPLVGKDGLFLGSLSLMATLPGFFFAGLAAVATFGSSYMDNLMPAPTPRVQVQSGGVMTSLDLSRRQFLSYLFSYLVIISFVLCFLLIAMGFSGGSLDVWKKAILAYEYGLIIWSVVKYVSLALVLFLLWSVVVTTAQGMYFLAEKIHQP